MVQDENNDSVLNLATADYSQEVTTTTQPQKPRQQSKQIISSLFTSNPAASVPESIQQKSKEKTNFTPSNGIINSLGASSTSPFPLDERLTRHLSTKLQITAPTPIQSQAIPAILDHPGRDVIIQAQTGSGKTYCFLLPIVHQLLQCSGTDLNRQGQGIQALILLPTRELAQQVFSCLERLLSLHYHPRWIVPCLLCGGEKKKSEKARLRKGVSILVGTPGRVLDHLKSTKAMDMRQSLKYLVLDEADRFEEMGFHAALKEIMSFLNAETRMWSMILCSATLTRHATQFGDTQLKNMLFVSADSNNDQADVDDEAGADDHVKNDGKRDLASVPNQLRQHYLLIPAKLRLVTLSALIRKLTMNSSQKILIFFSNCDSVDFHYQLLTNELVGTTQMEAPAERTEEDLPKFMRDALKAAALEEQRATQADITEPEEQDPDQPSAEEPTSEPTNKPLCPLYKNATTQLFKLHSKLSHQDRFQIISRFSKCTQSAVMLCTDIAARGLDIPLQTIIQYDAPTEIKDYIHRVGRTARLGKAGEAYLFLMPHEAEYLDVLVQHGVVGKEMAVENVLKSLLHDEKSSSNSNGGGGKKVLMQKKSSKQDQEMEWREEATRWQIAYERVVTRDAKLKRAASAAYLSSIKAYATHQKQEKSIFNVKKMHLGHIAKAFALRDPPGKVNFHRSEAKKKKKEARAEENVEKKVQMKQKILSSGKRSALSEFDSGYSSTKKIKLNE